VSESFRTSDGRTLAFRRVGSGPVLVCHGGGPGFSSLYLGDLAGLVDSFELVLVDPRGTGGSDRPPDARSYTNEDYAADVDELRRHLGLDRIDLLGHSHGGVVAIEYAASFPDRVRKLVLASTPARFHAEQEEAMVHGMEAKAGEPWYEDARAALEAEQAGQFETDEELGALALRELPFYFARYGDAERAYLDELAREIPNADTLRFFNTEIFPTFDLRPKLGSIRAETLVITGSEDFITGPVCARELADGIPGAREVLIPGAGHFVFVEARDAFAAEVRAFLGS
jgi:pimeloyl-ACP methyl ester carboxylesterase